MLILSRVCAEFRDQSGAPLFKVTPETRLTFLEAPEEIRQDPLFSLLQEERSIEVSDNGPRKKQLENDPETPPAKASGSKKGNPPAPSGTGGSDKP